MSDTDSAASMPDIPDTARAMVLTGIRELEMQSFPIPEIGPDEGLLRMEVCGIAAPTMSSSTAISQPVFR